MFPIGGPNALKTNNPCLVDNKVGTFGDASCFIQYAKGLHHFLIPVTEKGIADFEEIGKGLLRKDRIGADPQNFSIFCLKFCIIVRTGRLQLLNSGGGKVQDVKIDKNILPPKAAELKLPSLGTL